jgi:hypothetical protein
MKDKLKSVRKDTVTAYHNGVRLVEALALLAVAGYTIYQNLPSRHDVTVISALLLFAGFVIALRGGYEFLRHLAQK